MATRFHSGKLFGVATLVGFDEKRCRKNLPLSGEPSPKMTDSFWTGGPKAYLKGLREHYKPQLDDLRGRREGADEPERAVIDAEIKRVEAEYKSKLDSIDDALF